MTGPRDVAPAWDDMLLSCPLHAGFTARSHDAVTGPSGIRAKETKVSRFLKLLALQRWDDHRYYHQSRINQSLHFISAVSFLCAYVVLFFDPALAALIAWLVSMTTRQAGHFFFEPRGYDHVNQASDEHKEAIKVGYNLRRKIVLLSVWALLPLLLWLLPDMGGLIVPAVGVQAWLHDVGMAWLALGVGGVLLRTVHLFFMQGVLAGLAWATKILTDPFHDIMLYWRAPLHLLRGELLDPMHHVRGH
ncbi:conserved membrane hypothetical protein [Rubrivivax sp. A210]|nr:conserved membrane hypothetical protein [Rubrivivax sp. A210]